MDEDDLTPTKTIARVNISPKSKETVCILCVEVVSNPDYRRKLFSGSNKSQAYVSLIRLSISFPGSFPWLGGRGAEKDLGNDVGRLCK